MSLFLSPFQVTIHRWGRSARYLWMIWTHVFFRNPSPRKRRKRRTSKSFSPSMERFRKVPYTWEVAGVEISRDLWTKSSTRYRTDRNMEPAWMTKLNVSSSASYCNWIFFLVHLVVGFQKQIFLMLWWKIGWLKRRITSAWSWNYQRCLRVTPT